MSRVMVVGLGYVGLPLAIRAAERGHQVVGVDLDAGKIEALRRGTTYLGDVSDERIERAVTSGRFTAEVGWADAQEPSHNGQPIKDVIAVDVAIIAVPTPLREATTPDLSYVEDAGRMIGQVLRPGAAVVLESTSYPGTTEEVLAEAVSKESGLTPGIDFHLGFSPERIVPGASPYTLENTPKLVSATTPEGLDVIDRFYASIVDQTVRVSSPKVAELAKIFENTQAYVNIALINELADICRDLDIDVHEMIDAAMTKGHSMAYWTPGPGVGGHCLPIDPLYLAWQTRTELGRPFRFAELAEEINAARPHQVVERAVRMLNDRGVAITGTEVLVLGVSYKPGVGDLRESPALGVVDGLLDRGAVVTVADPYVTGWTLTPQLGLEDLTSEVVGRFGIVVVVTDHDEFDYDKLAVSARLVLDCRNRVPSAENVVQL